VTRKYSSATVRSEIRAGEGHAHRPVPEQGGDGFEAHGAVETGAVRCSNPAEWVVGSCPVLHLVSIQRGMANRVRAVSAA
jgi:hypothetical protein